MLMILDWKQFPIICKLWGLERFIGDARFVDADTTFEHAEELIPEIDAAMLQKTSLEWAEIFTANEIPFARLTHIKDIKDDEQAKANNFIYPMETKWGTFYLPAPPVQMGGSFPPDHYRAAPLVGEHTAEVMKELGYSDEEIAELEKESVIQTLK